MDSRLGQLVLARIGPWPEEERLGTFRWEPVDGPVVTFRIEAGLGCARVFLEERGSYPVLETRAYVPAGDAVGTYTLDADAEFRVAPPDDASPRHIVAHVPSVGEWRHIFDQGVGEAEPWYVNDHCLIRGDDGWHLYGITHPQPADPIDERNFAHAVSDRLDQGWRKLPFALAYSPAHGENHLWAPHVVRKDDLFYMFYCAGSQRSGYDYRIHLATSPDLTNWTRYDDNPLFEDFYDARDPMVLEVDGLYHLYYTANRDLGESHHVVNVRMSEDLLHWSPARVAFVHPEKGTFGGPTESPFVVPYGDHFYLFVGPDGDYRRTVVYRSPNPYAWRHEDQIAAFPSHAAEVVVDEAGGYWVTNAGWDLDGVYLAPLKWLPEGAPPLVSPDVR